MKQYGSEMSSNLSEQRLIENEARQRAENEKARQVLKNVLSENDVINFICECLNQDCKERIALTNRQFTESHENSKEFVVKPNHETIAIETVVRKTDDYYVVRKHVDSKSPGL